MLSTAGVRLPRSVISPTINLGQKRIDSDSAGGLSLFSSKSRGLAPLPLLPVLSLKFRKILLWWQKLPHLFLGWRTFMFIFVIAQICRVWEMLPVHFISNRTYSVKSLLTCKIVNTFCEMPLIKSSLWLWIGWIFIAILDFRWEKISSQFNVAEKIFLSLRSSSFNNCLTIGKTTIAYIKVNYNSYVL